MKMKRTLLTCIVVVALIYLPPVVQSQIPSIPGVGGIPGVNQDFMGSLGMALGGASPAQTAGAAGSIFGLAKARLSPADFTKVASAVPGMDGLLAAAPSVSGPVAPTGLESLTSSFTELGLKPDMVSKAIPVVTKYVSKSGGK